MSTGPITSRTFQLHRPLADLNPVSSRDSAQQPINAPRQFAAPRADRRHNCPVTPRHGWYLTVKRVADLAFAIGLLVIAAPIVLLAALLVKLSSRGPAFYRQVRVGKGGRPFTLLKLRTMQHNAEAETGPVWSIHNDPRVTRLGDLLRRTHIDEFPQLLNVILGQMSLVGPRPERPEFVAKLDWEVPYYRERLRVRPGITGLAQMRLPPDVSLDCVRRKVIHDVYYVRHVNPLLDLKLLCMTAWRLVKEVFSFCWNCVVLPSPLQIEQGFEQAVGIAADGTPQANRLQSHASLASISEAGRETNADMTEYHQDDRD